ncbi:hypothetical protein, partial [Salmonella enterica]|uniref:hypothetical protein n=1 Tax=Salmonella enterica TaxID=28901 RepID=UPI0032B61C40
PAGAGNTDWAAAAYYRADVYRRGRWELLRSGLDRAADRGLSPLARGTHNPYIIVYKVLGFISAVRREGQAWGKFC